MEKMTYRDAGVDIDAGNESVSLIKDSVRATYRPEVLGDLGGFGGLFALRAQDYREPVLVSGTDGVGTKLRLAFLLNRHDTIGQDAVAMCVNDILVQGAEPLFFLDYLAVGKLEPTQVAVGEYDIAGFAVGVVERERLITSALVKAGDVLLGLPSSGVHSNGYSLVRKIVFEHKGFHGDEYMEELGHTIGEELLTPTRLYPQVCLPLIRDFDLHGMVHITGGGFYENIPRALPDGMGAEVNAAAWEMPAVFRLLQEWGNVDWAEMYRTFNMGIGMVLIASEEEAARIEAHLDAQHEAVFRIGHVTEGAHETTIKGGVFDA